MAKADPYDKLIETLKETPIEATDYPTFKEFCARRWKNVRGGFYASSRNL